MYYMYNKHPFRKYWYIRYSDLLGKIFHPKYKEYAGLNDYWFNGREQGYWWRINYYSPFSEAYRIINNIKIVRLAKPRILFLDWVINVLIAYKNEIT